MSESLTIRVKNISRTMTAAITLMVFIGDQATKAMVVSSIPEHAVIRIIPHFLNLTNVSNAGAAFGMFSDAPSPLKSVILIIVSAALLTIVLIYAWRNPRLHWEAGVGLALILGGALSNLVDRVRLGRVVDFLDFYLRGYHWYTFNLADSAIVVGAGFLIIQVIFVE